VFLVFARALDGRLASLVRAIDKSVADNADDKRTGFVVLLDDNTAENQEKVAAFAKQHEVAIPMTIAPEGAKGPGAYKINPEVPVTVLAYKGKKVKANFALPAPGDEEAQAKEAADLIAAADKAFE